MLVIHIERWIKYMSHNKNSLITTQRIQIQKIN